MYVSGRQIPGKLLKMMAMRKEVACCQKRAGEGGSPALAGERHFQAAGGNPYRPESKTCHTTKAGR